MSDYSAVAPPSNLNFDPSSAFADALQRARQIAAKINPMASSSDGEVPNLKRPAEDSNEGQPDPKKLAAVNDPFGAQLAAMHQQQSIKQKKFQPTADSELKRNPTINSILNEDFKVPDKMVGLIIGRGGEQITKLQSESGCKVQIAADSGGLPDRPCTLTGTRQAIEKAKDLIQKIVERGQGTAGLLGLDGSMPDGSSTIEMMIPGNKVGLVIGKGGETIKMLQERAGVKMVMIQDGPQQTIAEKPLRISGEPSRCDHARQLVEDLIAEKDLEVRDAQQVAFGRGRGRGRGRGDGNRNDFGPPRPGPPGVAGGGRFNQSGDMQETTFSVPANKCGLVIGKGGETIRQINQQSGAHVELSRHAPPNPNEKIFVLRGNPQQIHHAQQLINEKIIGGPGASIGPGTFTQQSNGQNPPQPQGFAPQGWGNAYHHWQNQPAPTDPSKQAADADAAAWAAYYAQYYGQGQQQPPHNAQPPQQPPAQAGATQTQAQSPTTQTTANTNAGGQPDYSAAWADYYRSLGMHQQADMIEQQARANQQGQQPAAPAAAQYAQPAQQQPYAQYTQPTQYQQPPAAQYPQNQQYPPQGQYPQQYPQAAPPQQYNYGQ